ncbi:sugar phosphate isomerase/epimerase [Streptomonospora sediminis]
MLSTASVYPEKTPAAFEIAARLGYDGVEVLVSTDPVSQDIDMLRRLSDYHGVPILAVHAPCLIFTQLVWGRDPWGKLVKSKEMAEALGARTIVVHPAFRWQREYAREFEAGIDRMQDETDVTFAVENMYPVRMRDREVVPYAPSWNPIDRGYPDVTLDLSHSAMSHSDGLEMAKQLGDRLSHLHLTDGTGTQNFDEHLIPGRGTQPCSAVLEHLATTGYDGQIVLEVNTRKAADSETRHLELAEALAFTRLHFAGIRSDPASEGSGHVRERATLLNDADRSGAAAEAAEAAAAAEADALADAAAPPRTFAVSAEGTVDRRA